MRMWSFSRESMAYPPSLRRYVVHASCIRSCVSCIRSVGISCLRLSPSVHLQDLLAARARFNVALSEGDLQAAGGLVEAFGRGQLVNAGLPEGPLPLHYTTEAGREESVRWLLQNGAWLSDLEHPWVEPVDPADADRLCSVQAQDWHNACPGQAELAIACRHGHLGIAKYLVEEKGAEPERKGVSNLPLLCAAANGHLLLIQYLLQLGVQVRV